MRRAIAVTLLLLVVPGIGNRLPLPGLTVDAINEARAEEVCRRWVFCEKWPIWIPSHSDFGEFVALAIAALTFLVIVNRRCQRRRPTPARMQR